MILYESKTLRILDATIPGDSGTIVVTFPARSDRQGLHRPGFGEDFFRKRNVSAVHIKADWNHWFQEDPMGAVADAINAVTNRFCRRVTYGSSMGGYGAMAYSKLLNADAVVAISPQWSIDRAKVPFERRWAEDARRITFRHDAMDDLARAEAELLLIYDPRSADGMHANLIATHFPQRRTLLMPFGGHPAGTMLREAKLISRVIRDAVAGSLDAGAARADLRAARRNSALYWSNMSIVLQRRRPSLAAQAAFRATELDPTNAQAQAQLGKILLRHRQFVAATKAFEVAIKLKPNVAKYHAMLGEAHLRAAESGARAAATAFARSQKLGKLDAETSAGLARALDMIEPRHRAQPTAAAAE